MSSDPATSVSSGYAGNFRPTLVAAGALGLAGVALGALGAHALAPALAERGMTHAWETGARYHLTHALALFVAAAWLRQAPAHGTSSSDDSSKWIQRAARCWTVGVILFSGSLYALALGGPRWIGPITPLGGVALLLGWVCVLVAASARRG